MRWYRSPILYHNVTETLPNIGFFRAILPLSACDGPCWETDGVDNIVVQGGSKVVGRVLLTHEGYVHLEHELGYLSDVRRREIAESLRQVLLEGFRDDWDNVLDEVRNEQGFIEGRISHLRQILANAETIPEPGQIDVVTLGSKVTVVDLGGDGCGETYRLVGGC